MKNDFLCYNKCLFITIILLLIPLFIIIFSTSALSADQKTNKNAERRSQAFLEKQLEQLFDHQSKVKILISGLSETLVRVRDFVNDVNKFKPIGPVTGKDVNEFKNSFNKFQEYIKNHKEIDLSGNIVREFINFHRNVINKTVNNSSLEDKWDDFYALTPRQNIQEPSSRITRRLHNLSQKNIRKRARTKTDEAFNTLRRFIREDLKDNSETQGNSVVQVSAISKSITEVENAVRNLSLRELNGVIEQSKKELQESVGNFSKLLVIETETLNRSLNKINTNIDDVNRELTTLEKGKANTDNRLVIAVYFMIAALLIMFLALWVFEPATAYWVIEKRTLVHVVGIAFLLLTIIILGTGEKIDKAALAALLGTIAGYVFGRGTDTVAGSRNNDPQADTPTAGTPTPPAGTPTPPAGTPTPTPPAATLRT